MRRVFLFLIIFFSLAGVLGAEQTVAVAPTAPFERFIIFQTLTIFWVGIIGLVIIIKMRLREIERTQKMRLDKEEKNIPVLD